MKNYADLGGCYPPKTEAEVDNTLDLLGLHNSSYHTHDQPPPIIVYYRHITFLFSNMADFPCFDIDSVKLSSPHKFTLLSYRTASRTARFQLCRP